MTDTELKHVYGHIADARASGNPAIQSLAAVCEYLLSELSEIIHVDRKQMAALCELEQQLLSSALQANRRKTLEWMAKNHVYYAQPYSGKYAAHCSCGWQSEPSREDMNNLYQWREHIRALAQQGQPAETKP